VETVRAGRSQAELAEPVELSEQRIRNWVKQAERDGGRRRDGLRAAEKEGLGRLRREVRSPREKWAILARAAAWFLNSSGSPRQSPPR